MEQNAEKKSAGTVWIDEADRRSPGSKCALTITPRCGGILGSLQKGTRIDVEQSPSAMAYGWKRQRATRRGTSCPEAIRQNVHVKDVISSGSALSRYRRSGRRRLRQPDFDVGAFAYRRVQHQLAGISPHDSAHGGRPRPRPVNLVLKKGSKARSRTSCAMPQPLSSTTIAEAFSRSGVAFSNVARGVRGASPDRMETRTTPPAGRRIRRHSRSDSRAAYRSIACLR